MGWTCALWMAFPTVFVSIFLSPISGLGRESITMSWDVKPWVPIILETDFPLCVLGLGTGGCLALLDHSGLQQVPGHEGLLQPSTATKVEAPGSWSHGARTMLWADLPVTRHPAPLGRKPPGLRVSASSSGASAPTLGGVFPVQTYVGFYSQCMFLHLTLSKVEATQVDWQNIQAQPPAVLKHSCSLGPAKRHSSLFLSVWSTTPSQFSPAKGHLMKHVLCHLLEAGQCHHGVGTQRIRTQEAYSVQTWNPTCLPALGLFSTWFGLVSQNHVVQATDTIHPSWIS